ncbi:MAG TPA: tRNA pseudouridine(38-40) synthase TruA [Firmicutes bacterium]|nr:tRNA pseudouridine(38-40) synthase TruA [Bacillota bacterium]
MAPEGLRRLGAVVQYDGSRFHGFQLQGEMRTVQLVLERALEKVTGRRVRVLASGRTDAGVHALGQVVSFDTDVELAREKWVPALNAWLPEDVSITQVFDAPLGFHPRFSACSKTYVYVIYEGEVRSPFLRSYTYHYRGKLDSKLMKLEAKALEGEHDFAAFCATGSSVRSTVRRVFSAELCELPVNAGRLLILKMEANGFLYNMVRICAGTLLEVGRGRLPTGTVRRCLETGRREDAGETLPAQGVWLLGVRYDFLDTAGWVNYNDFCRLITGGQEVCGNAHDIYG